MISRDAFTRRRVEPPGRLDERREELFGQFSMTLAEGRLGNQRGQIQSNQNPKIHFYGGKMKKNQLYFGTATAVCTDKKTGPALQLMAAMEKTKLVGA